MKAIKILCRQLPIHERLDEQICFLGRFTSNIPELLESACRGGGKTEGGCIGSCIVCAGEPGTPLMWLAGNTGQLEEASKNMHLFVPLFGGWWGNSRWTKNEQARFPNGSTIDFSPMTMTSGPRKFTIVKDEGGKVVEPVKKRRYKEAEGMKRGTWDYPKRTRHLTTLAYDTAIEPVYDRLNPLGLVWKFPEEACPWVHQDLIDDYGPNYPDVISKTYGRPYFRTEYKCIMDTLGVAFHIFNKVMEITELPTFYLHGDRCLIGLDTNPGVGHAALVGIQQGFYIYLVDEWLGLALRPPVEADDPPITDKSGMALAPWIKMWQARFPGRCGVVCETQGQSIADSLVKLGVRGMDTEPWTGSLQKARIPMTVDLCDQGLIQFLKQKCGIYPGVPVTIEQAHKYHKDEKHNIPKQDDHHIDDLHHLLMARPKYFKIESHEPAEALY